MLFCRCREGIRVELALRLAPGIHSYGQYYVKIGLILHRLFILTGASGAARPVGTVIPTAFAAETTVRSLLEAAETTLSNAQV